MTRKLKYVQKGINTWKLLKEYWFQPPSETRCVTIVRLTDLPAVLVYLRPGSFSALALVPETESSLTEERGQGPGRVGPWPRPASPGRLSCSVFVFILENVKVFKLDP